MIDKEWLKMAELDLQVVIFFFAAGFVILVSGLAAKRGHPRTRGLFMFETNPLVSVDAVYGSLPIGLGSILVGIAFVLNSKALALLGLGGGTILGFVFIIWKPRWMKPDWLLWLEEHYDRSTIEFMFDQVRHDRTWSKRVSTQEELEAWAEEMAHEHELEL
jgi:hypothetical protein